MHYKNGREAKVGDQVVGTAYNTKGPIAGKIVSITEENDSCDCIVAFIGDAVLPVKTDYSQCTNFYHVEDAFALSDAAYAKPKPTPDAVKIERDDTNYPGYAERLSASHAPLLAEQAGIQFGILTKKPLLKLEEKPCGDVWLHVTPKKGPLASIDLGKRGSHINPSIIHQSLLVAIEEQNE